MSDRIYIIVAIVLAVIIPIVARIWSRIEERRFERDMDEWVRDMWENAGQKTEKSKETEPAEKKSGIISFCSCICENVIKDNHKEK